LTGVWGMSADLESSVGKMEFRRIPARYFTVYPCTKELRDNKPRALWRFAIAAVRNDIRRDRWSWSHFFQRRDDRKAVVSLLVRSRWFGTPLSDEEAETLHVIARGLIPADAFFYDSKIDHIRAYTWVHENAQCDSCGGRIGGPRLFCLDCDIKSSEFYNTLDLCSAPQCIGASVTREDLEKAHEPNHRLVKVRTSVLTRSHGRVHTAACDAFGRVQETCRKVAESTLDSDEEAKPDVEKTSSSEPTSTEMPVKGDKPDDELNPPDGAKDEAEVEGKTSRDAGRGQVEDQNLPSCGKCDGSLSFPFWYCIFCEDNLFICNACDTEGVPELMRCSGKHTEEHHLIRCLAPEKYDDDDTLAADERLLSIENRLDGMQTRFDDLTACIGDLTSRMGNIEQLLQNLARIGGGGGEGEAAQS